MIAVGSGMQPKGRETQKLPPPGAGDAVHEELGTLAKHLGS